MNITNITGDMFVVLFFAVLAIYGMLLGRTKVLGILVNLYIALAVTLVCGDAIYAFASNFQLISNNLATSVFGVKTLLMVILTGLLTLKSEVAGLDSGDSLSTFQTGLYGLFTAGVILSSALMFMSNAQRMVLDSNLVNLVYDWRIVLVAAPVLYIIGSSFIRSKY